MGTYYNGGSAMKGVDWSYFNKFSDVDEKYLPPRGEGENKATQICTAVSKIVYKWYNDGDVFDNVHSGMDGWANDLSDYANWIWTNVPEARPILEDVKDCYTDGEYECLLARLCDTINTMEFLKNCENVPKIGSVYECDGPFKYRDPDDCWDDDDDEDEWDDDDDDEEEEE